MARLAFLHFNIRIQMTGAEKREGADYLMKLIQPVADALFRQKTEVNVDIHDGSAKIWLAVAGSLYLAIGQYGSFRSGVDQIIEDVKLLKGFVTSDLQKCGVEHDDFLESNRLTTTPDKLRRIYLQIESLEKSGHRIPSEEQVRKTRTIEKNIIEVLNHIEYLEDFFAITSSIPAKYQPNNERIPFDNYKHIPTIRSQAHELEFTFDHYDALPDNPK